jgi:hypothetical protein
MDFGLGILTFGTLGFVCVFAWLEARATEKRRLARRAAAAAPAAPAKAAA